MYYERIWSVEVRGKTRKALKRFPAKDAEVILAVIESFQTDPFSGDIEKLGGEDNAWRRRIGSYRIFYEVYPHTRSVYIYKIERRGSHTY